MGLETPVLAAIETRRSVRGFLPRAVPREPLKVFTTWHGFQAPP